MSNDKNDLEVCCDEMKFYCEEYVIGYQGICVNHKHVKFRFCPYCGKPITIINLTTVVIGVEQ